MEAKKVWFDTEFIFVETIQSKIGKMPLKWFPHLRNANLNQLEQFELWSDNSWIHWEVLGEDLSVEGFFTFKKELQSAK